LFHFLQAAALLVIAAVVTAVTAVIATTAAGAVAATVAAVVAAAVTAVIATAAAGAVAAASAAIITEPIAKRLATRRGRALTGQVAWPLAVEAKSLRLTASSGNVTWLVALETDAITSHSPALLVVAAATLVGVVVVVVVALTAALVVLTAVVALLCLNLHHVAVDLLTVQRRCRLGVLLRRERHKAIAPVNGDLLNLARDASEEFADVGLRNSLNDTPHEELVGRRRCRLLGLASGLALTLSGCLTFLDLIRRDLGGDDFLHNGRRRLLDQRCHLNSLLNVGHSLFFFFF
jgi:hypothetical protein